MEDKNSVTPEITEGSAAAVVDRGLGKKYVPGSEAILFTIGIFFVAALTGVVNSYRFNYLNDVVFVGVADASEKISLITTIFQIVEYAMWFLFIFIIDRTKTKYGRFKPYGIIFTIPAFLASIFMFWNPDIDINGASIMVYFIAVNVVYAVANTFINSVKNISNVITPNNKERTMLITWRDILSAIGNSAPLLFYLIFEILQKKDIIFHTVADVYLGTAISFGIVGSIMLLTGLFKVKERVVVSVEKTNPLSGLKQLLSNKNYLSIGFSEFIKNARALSQYTGIYLAVVLLGSKGMYLVLGLPTAIGTFVGMLLIKLLLKKFSTKVLYIASGFYSITANVLAFFIGYSYFRTGSTVLQVAFVAVLFLIGLQFGASNLLPNIFNADVLDEMELKTGKRLDSTLMFANTTFSRITAITATALAPFLMNKFIGVNTELTGTGEELATAALAMKVKLLACYTLIPGACMALCGLPYLPFKIVGKEKDRIMKALENARAERNSLVNIADNADTIQEGADN
ncbi:MAG: MFS transporter [Christensenellaceae bacterium]|jgi:Na+/melibiose symporter-like transporter|nr:MFS transporter [Christensenellaceae bacterium]